MLDPGRLADALATVIMIIAMAAILLGVGLGALLF